MPYQHKKLTYWVLITNCLIIIGAGHGIAPILFFEFILPFNMGSDGFDFCVGLHCSYDQSLFLTAILSFCGQLLLLIANSEESSISRIVSLTFMWLGLFYICHNFDEIATITFLYASPFIITSGYLIYLIISGVFKKQQICR